MLAVDTNVLIRSVTADDPEQSPQAQRFIESHDVFISSTVLLETELVLRYTYGQSQRDIVRVLRGFVGLPTVTVEEAGSILQALDWTEEGMDFADALHLTKAASCDAFISYDKRCARLARRLGTLEVRSP